MESISFLLNNVNENTADFLIENFKAWLNNELFKKIMKNRGKLFKFHMGFSPNEDMCSIKFGNTYILLAARDAKDFDEYEIYVNIVEAIKECKKILYNFAEDNNLTIEEEESKGFAIYYNIYRKGV